MTALRGSAASVLFGGSAVAGSRYLTPRAVHAADSSGPFVHLLCAVHMRRVFPLAPVAQPGAARNASGCVQGARASASRSGTTAKTLRRARRQRSLGADAPRLGERPPARRIDRFMFPSTSEGLQVT